MCADFTISVARIAPGVSERILSTAPTPGTVRQLIARFLREHANAKARQRLQHFSRFCGLLRIADVDADLLFRYRDSQEQLANATVRDNLIYARAVLRLAVRRGWLACEPERPRLPAVVHNPRGAVDLIPPLLHVLEHAPRGRNAWRVLRFIFVTGCRPSEACDLHWEMLGPGGDYFVIARHKTARTGQPRTLYLNAQAKALLPQRRMSGPVFLSTRGQPYTAGGLRVILQRAARRLFGQAVSPYQLRHSFAQLARRQIQPDVLMTLLGHRTLSTTLLYYRIENAEALNAARGLRLPP